MSRDKKTSIKMLKDGRYSMSIKNKTYNSKKSETKDTFLERLFNIGVIVSLDSVQTDIKLVAKDSTKKSKNNVSNILKSDFKDDKDISENIDYKSEIESLGMGQFLKDIDEVEPKKGIIKITKATSKVVCDDEYYAQLKASMSPVKVNIKKLVDTSEDDYYKLKELNLFNF